MGYGMCIIKQCRIINIAIKESLLLVAWLVLIVCQCLVHNAFPFSCSLPPQTE